MRGAVGPDGPARVHTGGDIKPTDFSVSAVHRDGAVGPDGGVHPPNGAVGPERVAVGPDGRSGPMVQSGPMDCAYRLHYSKS